MNSLADNTRWRVPDPSPHMPYRVRESEAERMELYSNKERLGRTTGFR
jgi:hypothetical protein